MEINKNFYGSWRICVQLNVEYRQYDTENPDDPLHAGRSHIDSKFDMWVKKKLGDSIGLSISSRYRARSTNSDYEWVDNLKSFKQFQHWIKLEWDLIYDRY